MAYSPQFHPVLRSGDRHVGVRAAKRAVHRALKAKGIKPRSSESTVYGANFVKDVHAFKAAYNVTVGGRPSRNGHTIGRRAWVQLIPFLDRYAKIMLARYKAARLAARARERARERARARRTTSLGERIAEAMLDLFERGQNVLVYAQIRPFPLTRSIDELKNRLDCSSTMQVAYWMAGAPDPSGLDHSGYGYTGTQWARGRFVSLADARPGDLVFYGYDSRGDFPGHVAGVYAGRGSDARVISFGSTPIKNLPVAYRPVRGVKRYV